MRMLGWMCKNAMLNMIRIEPFRDRRGVETINDQIRGEIHMVLTSKEKGDDDAN